MLVANKYIVKEFIGQGKFGSVCKGEKIGEVSKIVAIKFECKKTPIPLLKIETRILEYLARNGLRKWIPQVFWYGLHEEYICTVMSYLGEVSLLNIEIPSLDFLMDWFHTAISMLEKIHLYGVIHRDLKPAHFLFHEGKWILIDFGFATFVSEESDKKRECILGTPNYISISVHDGFYPGKKDDMISLGYILLEKIRGILPWSTIPSYENPGNYPMNHLLHPSNVFRRSSKESIDISDIPVLYDYMKKLEHSSKRST